MYALIQEGQIVSYGALPHKIQTNGRWYNLRPPEPEIVAEAGFVKVVEVPRPEDTETVVYDNWDVELVEGVPTMVWRFRTLSQEEIDQRAQMALEQSNAQTLTADAAADLPRLEQALADTLLLLGPNDQPGSIRHHRTTVLTNQYQVAAQRSQDDLILALAVIVRRLVRQQIRDTRLQTGTLDSADVGPDAT